jgi:hypothetical protein
MSERGDSVASEHDLGHCAVENKDPRSAMLCREKRAEEGILAVMP